MSVTPIQLPHWPSGPAIREEERIAAAQRRLDEEAVKLWGSGSPCERPWRPDTGLLQRVPAELYPNWRGPFPIPWERDDRPWPGNDPFTPPGMQPGPHLPSVPNPFIPPDPSASLGSSTSSPSVPAPFVPQGEWNLRRCCELGYTGGYAAVADASTVFPREGKGSGRFDPDNRRIMLAVSDDGLVWRRTGIILADRADVPSMIYDPVTGRFWVFFMIFEATTVRGGSDHVSDVIVAGCSATNSIEQWTFFPIVLDFEGTGESGDGIKYDPCIVSNEGGGEVARYLLYFTMNSATRGESTWVAVSDDLTDPTWRVQPGPAYDHATQPVRDPAVVKVGSEFELFAWPYDDGGTLTAHHAVSADGLHFAAVGDGSFTERYAGMPVWFSNGLALPGPPYFRYYAFSQEPGPTHVILSLEPGSAGAYDWDLEAGVRLEVDETTGSGESAWVREAAVARAGQSSCYLMAYATEIP